MAAVLDFSVDPLVVAAMGRARDKVGAVARERVRDELVKLLGATRPSIGIELMRETGILEEVLPELLEGYGMEQNRHHAYDVYHHTLHSLDAAPEGNLPVRLAALLHDIGKPRTRKVVGGEGTFHRHEQVGAEMTREILSRLRFSRAQRERISHLVAEHMFHYTPDWSDGAVRRFLHRVGEGHVEDLFELREADNRGSGRTRDSGSTIQELKRRIQDIRRRDEAVSIKDLDIDGDAVMAAAGLSPGPEVGRILTALLERVLDDPGLNRREVLLDLIPKVDPRS